ncbi:pyridoxamine 5'-phosphate oxidase family protein [Saxibacter everestensis]|uniref:Pyridoxamine 5'-phosphate oxidase family protein n=1 Tax=Saxibacter everestensis TaxID=2909229 RepID=A0ABY8QTN6_9MICO|nr:pyridoxamine 5'-phosphate oxidase family protein [Brevibacteriaceae bacterium ZFBP1038]
MPRASRPHMPGYGLLPANEGSGLLPWSWAENKLRNSHDYWIATSWPSGRPHLMPVWGVWLDETLWFSSGSVSRKVRNLSERPECTAAIDDAVDPVVLDGIAEIRGAEQDRQRFLRAVNEKYGVDYGLDFLDGITALCLRVRPVSAFGLMQSDFAGSPTRWTFGESD